MRRALYAMNDPVRPVPTRVTLTSLCVRLALHSPRARLASITPAISPLGVYGWDVKAHAAVTIGEVTR